MSIHITYLVHTVVRIRAHTYKSYSSVSQFKRSGVSFHRDLNSCHCHAFTYIIPRTPQDCALPHCKSYKDKAMVFCSMSLTRCYCNSPSNLNAPRKASCSFQLPNLISFPLPTQPAKPIDLLQSGTLKSKPMQSWQHIVGQQSRLRKRSENGFPL